METSSSLKISNEERKQYIVEELQKLYKTMMKITELWGYDDLMTDELNINKMYPFKESFDELTAGVGEWADDVKNNYKIDVEGDK